MSIPPLNDRALLPEGIHDCSLEELRTRFGSFEGNDRRPRLWSALSAFVTELKAAGVGAVLLIDGSFVTAKSTPEDIDLILLLPAGHDLYRELTPAEYNVLSARRVRQRHRLDLLVAREGSDEHRRYMKLFQQVRLEPERTKGILRLRL